jgi:phosphoribosylformimino-5-aminoimidazole carboxamide ribotide isomerase
VNKPFRIIPVLDLKDNLVVRGIRGERAGYKPIQSKLCSSAEFSEVLEAFYLNFGFSEFYIADLDALISGRKKGQLQLLTDRKNIGGTSVSFMIDAGVSDAAGAVQVLQSGAKKVVVGTETLLSLEALQEMIDAVGSQHLMVSIDTKDSRVVSPAPEIAGLRPASAILEFRKAGVEEFILIQLSRVGTGEGLDQALIQDCLAVLRGNERLHGTLIVGGGVSGYEDLRWLADNGADGVLVASILHDAKVDRNAIQILQSRGRNDDGNLKERK